MSSRNKLNKAKQVIDHRCGGKSFQAISYDARDHETEKEPNYRELWRMTHTNNNGEWIDETSREVYMKVNDAAERMLEGLDEEANEDLVVNAAFQSVVGERSGYCRSLGAGIQPTKGTTNNGVHAELVKEREKRQDMEMKLKQVETQLQEERQVREEMATCFQESQKDLEERMEKQLQEKMASMFFRMQTFSFEQ